MNVNPREQQARELQTLTRRLVQVHEAQSRALSREIHDSSSQAITALKIGLAALRREAGGTETIDTRLDELRQIAETLGEDLHRLSVDLRPASLDRYGLVPALDQLLATVRQRAGLRMDFLVQGLEERLPDEVETALYRIAQEATTNIARYAAATVGSVLLEREGDTVRLIVDDNGRGFDLDEALGRGRLGLLGMRERAEMLGGSLTIETSPGHGTTLYVEVPAGGMGGKSEPTDYEPGISEWRGGEPVPEGDGNDNQVAELARAKALSDVLVDITAGMARQTDAQELLAFVLTRSAEAIDCDFAVIGLREGSHWTVSHGYRIPEHLLGQQLSDADVPVALHIERTRKMLVANDMRVEGPQGGMIRELGGLSGAGIPLLTAGKFVGVVAYVHSAAPVAFKPSEVDFLERLANLVALALENIHLREIETRQRTLLEAVFATVPVGLAVIAGSHSEIKLANGSYRSITPHPEVDPTGRRYVEIWPPGEGFDRGESWLINVMATGQPLDVARHMRVFPDGSQRFFAFHVRRLLWDGEPAALVVLMDTTATEQAGELVRQAAAELDAVLSSINDGLVVYNAGGQIVRLNRVAVEMLGYAEHDRASAFEDRARRFAPRKPDGTPYPFSELPAVRALAGETVTGSVMALSGTDRNTWVSASAAPLYGPDGELRGAVSTFSDITALHDARLQLEDAYDELAAAHLELQDQAGELAEANASLAEERDRLRALLNSIPDEVWFCDIAGKVMAANPAAARGLNLPASGEGFQPFPEWQALEILRPDGTPRPLEDAPLLRALRGEAVRGQEEIVRLPESGELRYRQADGDAVRDADGRVLGAVLVVRDITCQKQAEKERERARQALLEANQATVHLLDEVQDKAARLAAQEKTLRAQNEQLREAHSELLAALARAEALAAEREAILDAIADGLIVYDTAGRIVRQNAVALEMLGYSPEAQEATSEQRSLEAVRPRRPDGSVFDPGELPVVRALRGEVVRSQEMILSMPARAGRDLRVSVSAAPIRSPDGSVSGCVTTFSDSGTYHER